MLSVEAFVVFVVDVVLLFGFGFVVVAVGVVASIVLLSLILA